MSPAVREWLEAFNRLSPEEKREATRAFRSRGRPSRRPDDIADIPIKGSGDVIEFKAEGNGEEAPPEGLGT